jgi:cytochrome oxidase assembly protein ShyY1
MTGTYLSDDELLVRNRPFNGQPGFDVLTPLLLDDGTVFIVDRGWVATGSKQDYPDSIPRAPRGDVTVVARLKASERSLPGRSAPEGQVATIELPAIAELLDRTTYSAAYGLMDSEEPSVAVRPAAAVKPEADEGNHLSYAFQWIMFALVGFAGLGYAIRTEYRFRNAEDPAEKARAAERDRRAAARAPSDSDVEDAILDRSI